MTGNTCAVAICKSPKNVTYHNFPRNDPERLAAWIAACMRKDTINPACARICSTHFRPEDYDRDLRNELLNIPVRKLLKKTAVPTLNLIPEIDPESWIKTEEDLIIQPKGKSVATKRKITTSIPLEPSEDLNIAQFKIRVRDNLFDEERRERVKNILVPASSKRVVRKPETFGDYVIPDVPQKVRKVEKKTPVKYFTKVSSKRVRNIGNQSSGKEMFDVAVQAGFNDLSALTLLKLELEATKEKVRELQAQLDRCHCQN